ncbi:MAG TPA: helix-turn-helix transcriptional regulator [Candidatus Merdisoma merdipullorum]|nr:helix-turn-helix transcriptional regulator [Candidatus Merdisoma merdipullorum]
MIQGLPERLKVLRIQSGYSQKKAAEIAGISASILSGYESGEKTPSLQKILILANLYHVSVDYLLGVDKTDTHHLIDVSHLDDEQIMALRKIISSMK